MKAKNLLFIVMIFILFLTAACGGNATPAPPTEAPAEVPAEPAPVEEQAPTEAPMEEPTVPPPTEEPVPEVAPVESEFPLPDDASNVMLIGEGVTHFQTGLSMPDIMTFYRFAFPNYNERQELTTFSEDTFQLVFDGHESGKALIIQGFPVGDGTVNVNIRLGDA